MTMKKAKLFSVLFALALVIACTVGVLMTGTSAADGMTEWAVDGTTYSSIKAALTAAEKEEWEKDETLVITVDPAILASESISHDASGNAYPGGIAFGQKTIFRADGTRLPITVQGSSDRTAFTLNITAGTKVACANSYTFKNLTFPIGDSSEDTYFYAGSGIVRLENVVTSSGTATKGWLAGDNFTARAFDGWTPANVTANSDKNKRIITSMGIGTGTKYISSIGGSGLAKLLSHTVAVADSDGWDTFAGVSVTPENTSTEILVDGGEIGYMRGRIGTNPVGESIQRIESGKVSNIFGLGTHNTSTTYSQMISYKGDHTVTVNGGAIAAYSRVLFCAALDGNYTVNISGGTFTGYFQPGWSPSTVSGNFEMNVTGGAFNETANCFYAQPCATVGGTSIVNISGGTFAGPFQGTHNPPKNSSDTEVAIKSHVINVMPNAESSGKDPVFNGYFYATKGAGVTNVQVNISGGTFNSVYCSAHNKVVTNMESNVTGGTFNGAFYGGGVAIAGSTLNITNNISGGTFKGGFYGAGWYGTNKFVKNKVTGGEFVGDFYGGGATDARCYPEKVQNDISGGTFQAYFYGGSNASGTKLHTIINNISGGTFNYLTGGSRSVISTGSTGITNKLTGGEVKSNFTGGGNVADSNENVLNEVYDGVTVNGMFLGGNAKSMTGNVTNNVYGGSFGHFYFGAGVTTSVDGDVTNNISDGTFNSSAFGGTGVGTISGTVTNNICGPAMFKSSFAGVSGFQDLDVDATVGSVVNRVYKDKNGKAPTFLLNSTAQTCTYNSVSYNNDMLGSFSFMGGGTYSKIEGTITNTIEAGIFETTGKGAYTGGCRTASVGKDANGVSIYNYISGGTFGHYWYGGNMSSGITGEIRSEITGGEFKKRISGGNRSLTSLNTPISLKITDGIFHDEICPAYAGYTVGQAAGVVFNSTCTLTVEGGTFYGPVYGFGNHGGVDGSKLGCSVGENGVVRLIINGGTFYGDVIATSPAALEARQLGDIQIVVEPKTRDVTVYGSIASRFAAEKIALKGSTYKVLVDAVGSLNATSAEGVIDFQQVDKWKNATYLTLPAGHTATVNVSTSPEAYGYFETVLGENGEIVEVYGSALKMGASMVLTDRIAIKFQLSKEAVDAIENFTYSFTLPDGTVLAEGTKADLAEMIEITEFEYYTFILKSLGISQFETPITVNIKGLWENDTFSISTLAESAVSAWEGNDDFVLMAKAIVNMAKAAQNEALPYALTPDAVVYERKTPTHDEEALLQVSQKSLLMSSAVGVRISGTVASATDAEGLVVKVNGHDVTRLAKIGVDGTKVTVDLYFSAFGMGEEFELQILDKNGKNCLTMLERLDAFAAQYGTDHALAYSLLSYIQATSGMARASFNLAASEAEIAYLHSLYAGETAYYGDLHGHPGGGIIEDGKVDMSIWVSDRGTIGVDFYTAMNHKQVAHMYDDGWDDTVLIGGSEPATTVTKGEKKISVHYNMIVPNPETLIEVLQLFPEFKYTGGTDDIAINMGTFGYPKFTYDRFNELISAIKERGGTVVNVHPKQQWTSDDPLDYYYQDYMGLEVFYSYSDKNIHGEDCQDNYKLWTDLLALGKRVWATAGSDSHGSPVNTGLTTLYSTEALNTKYVEKIVSGNFAPGYVGIRMAIGDTEMGGHTDFEGKKLIFSVGDFHSKYLDQARAYRVNVITDQGVVYSTVVDATKTSYFSLDADEDAKFYRIEVVNEDIAGLPIVGLGNPIWND